MQDLAEIHQRLASARGAMTVAIGRKWTIRAQRHPIAVCFSRVIIFESIPFRFRLVEPVDVPDPMQIVGAFGTH